MPKQPPFDEKTGRPNFPAVAFNDKEMTLMRKSFFFINYYIKSGGLRQEDYKPKAPFDAKGEPNYNFHRLSQEELDMGKKMWSIISPNGQMPKEPPFKPNGYPSFNSQGFS